VSNSAHILKFVAIALSFAVSACGIETIVHGITEREANKIIEILADSDVQANKLRQDTGREITYSISVPAGEKLDAIRVLNRNELPERREMGYHEVFAESGLIPTSTEEKAKKLAAIEGEIERQLKLIDGILDVQVQIVMPEESALRTTSEQEPDTTASVTIKYMPGPGGSKPLSEPQVKSLVAAGVEKLMQDKVIVVMTPAVHVAAKGGSGDNERHKSWVRRFSDKQINLITAGGATLVLLLLIAQFYAQVRLNFVRTRLSRLQTEITKARRKPDSTSTSM
jgi:type III secretion system YscJ/HrcJ family lipoprotein